MVTKGLPRWLSGKESACQAEDTGDVGSVPGLGRSPGGGNGNTFQYSCLEYSVDRGAWQVTVHGVAELGTTEWLSMHTVLAPWALSFTLHLHLFYHVQSKRHYMSFMGAKKISYASPKPFGLICNSNIFLHLDWFLMKMQRLLLRV